MIRKVLLSLLVIGTSVVATAQKLENISSDFPKSTPIKRLEPITLKNIEKIGWYVIKDNLFITNTPTATNHCVAIDMKSGKRMAEFIEIGKGENQMESVESINLYGNDSLMAMTKKIVKTYAIKDLLKGSAKPNIINHPDSITSLIYTKIDGNTIMGAGASRNNIAKTRYYKATNDKCTTFMDINQDHFNVNMANPDGPKYQAKAQDYYSLMTPNKKTSLVAMATRNGRILEIINPKTMKIEKSKMYNKATINAEMHPSGKGVAKMYVIGFDSFNSINCDDKYIYVVMAEKGDEPKTANYSLLIFDWNLKPIKKYDIMKGRELISFRFSADMEYIYYIDKGSYEYVINRFAIEK